MFRHFACIWVVGDGGFEPPTSTMSTWRSTPELIAQLKQCVPAEKRATKILKAPDMCNTNCRSGVLLQSLSGQFIAHTQPDPPHFLDLVPEPGRLLEFQVPGMLQHLLLELLCLSQ